MNDLVFQIFSTLRMYSVYNIRFMLERTRMVNCGNMEMDLWGELNFYQDNIRILSINFGSLKDIIDRLPKIEEQLRAKII